MSIDAFGVDRPDLALAKRAKPVPMSRSEKRELGSGLGIGAAGAGTIHLGGKALLRGGELRADSEHRIRMARVASQSAHRSRSGLAEPHVWHAPGSAGHEAAGRVMHSISEAKAGVAGLGRARKLNRVGTGMVVGGLGAAAAGSLMADHAAIRWGNRQRKPASGRGGRR